MHSDIVFATMVVVENVSSGNGFDHNVQGRETCQAQSLTYQSLMGYADE